MSEPSFEQIRRELPIMVAGTQRALEIAMEALAEIVETGGGSERAEAALTDIRAVLSETSA